MGSEMSVNTADFRLPGGITTSMNRFTGSYHCPVNATVNRFAAAVATAASTSRAAMSGGVAVEAATASTNVRNHDGSTETGNVGRVYSPNGRMSDHASEVGVHFGALSIICCSSSAIPPALI